MMTSMITGSHDFRLGNQRKGRGFIWRLQYIEENLRSRLESNKDMLGMLNACLSTGELQPCIFSASCMTDSEFSKENKSCDIVIAICNDANQSCTKENIDNHLKESEKK